MKSTNHHKMYSLTAKCIWFCAVLFISWYYSFKVYPTLRSKLTNSYAKIYFVTKNSSGNTVYWQNTSENRINHLKEVSEKKLLYISLYELYPQQQFKGADKTRNWIGIVPILLKCNDVYDCRDDHIILSDDFKNLFGDFLTTIRTKDGKDIQAEPISSRQSLSEPSGWGDDGIFPLFLIFMLFGLKFGITLRDFWLAKNDDQKRR